MPEENKKPHIYAKKGITVNCTPGIYYACTCGKSIEQPFCDGSHEGTDFVPKRFKVAEPSQLYLCQCKYSKNMPYCDGMHSQLSIGDL